MATNTPSLQSISQSSVVESLGKTAGSIECLFACGGSIPEVEKVVVFYKQKKSEGWSPKPIELSAEWVDERSLADFFDVCSTASFGKGKESVIDRSYRDALKLEPDRFSANLHIANTAVLDHVTRLMPSSTPIRAELYMLNVYSAGGHFKRHVDTPRSADMFGSLVVCLPSCFEGGELVTRHQGREVKFDWSSTTTAQWSAFYSDVEHKVLPVISGHRITLTYNLYHTKPALLSSLNITTNPLYCELKAALQNPHFMREGGTLGFFCQHKYSGLSEFQSRYWGMRKMLSVDLEQFSPYLKGEDALVYEVTKVLQLSICLKSVSGGPLLLSESTHDYSMPDTKYIIPPQFYSRPDSCANDDHLIDTEAEKLKVMKDHFGGQEITTDEGVTWCQDLKKMGLVVESMEYGNEPEGCDIYEAAAFLIQVPEFTSGRGF